MIIKFFVEFIVFFQVLYFMSLIVLPVNKTKQKNISHNKHNQMLQ